jgi:hypothetical protein
MNRKYRKPRFHVVGFTAVLLKGFGNVYYDMGPCTYGG